MNEIGIEQARRHLGDLANAAYHHATTTYLTRNGRRIAAITPIPNAIITVAAPGDQVDGVDVNNVDHTLPTLTRPDIAAWLAANEDPDGDWLAINVDIDEPATHDTSGWPHLLVALTPDELVAVQAAVDAKEQQQWPS